MDLDLAIYEYDPINGVYVWSTSKTGGLWGTFSSDATAGGAETYTLSPVRWDYDVYCLVIDARNASAGATATVTVVQNGVTEVYGPYTVPAGGFYPSWGWPDWWENIPDPIFGLFTGPGGDPGPVSFFPHPDPDEGRSTRRGTGEVGYNRRRSPDGHGAEV